MKVSYRRKQEHLFMKLLIYLSYQSLDKKMSILHIVSFLFNIPGCFAIVSSKIKGIKEQREQKYTIIRRFVLKSKIMTSKAWSSNFCNVRENHGGIINCKS